VRSRAGIMTRERDRRGKKLRSGVMFGVFLIILFGGVGGTNAFSSRGRSHGGGFSRISTFAWTIVPVIPCPSSYLPTSTVPDAQVEANVWYQMVELEI